MSTLLKTLNETRGAKLKEAQAITQKLEAEKRGFTDDERNTIRGINDEVEKIDGDIHQEVRSISLLSQKPQELSRQEKRDVARFDFAKLLNFMHRDASGARVGALDGVEAELVQAGIAEARASGINAGGLVLPAFFVNRENRDMTAGGTTSVAGDQGGMTIATEKRGLLDDFFHASVIRQAGATVLMGLKGPVDFPRLVAGTAPAKKAENAAADEVSPLTAMLSLTPRRLPAYIDISESLLNQSNEAVEASLRTMITNQMLGIQELAFFHGGGTNEPTGLAATSGIGSVAGGTNGLAPTWAHLIALRKAVRTANAYNGNPAFITNGDMEAKLAVTPKVASTDSIMLLNDLENPRLAGRPVFFTEAVSSALTKGTSSGTCSAIFFGNFADFYVGYWGGISLEMIRDKTNAISGLYTLVASTYYDGGVVRPKSFAAMLDALGD